MPKSTLACVQNSSTCRKINRTPLFLNNDTIRKQHRLAQSAGQFGSNDRKELFCVYIPTIVRVSYLVIAIAYTRLCIPVCILCVVQCAGRCKDGNQIHIASVSCRCHVLEENSKRQIRQCSGHEQCMNSMQRDQVGAFYRYAPQEEALRHCHC
jgi:hypothetical protein